MEQKENEIISVRTVPDIKEFKNFCLKNVLSNNGAKALILLGIISTITSINSIVKILNQGDTIPGYLIATPGSFILCFAMMPFLADNLVKKIFSQRIYQEEQLFLISKDEIEIKTASSFTRVKISELYKVKENSYSFALFLSITIDKVFLLPKKSFKNAEEMTEFKKIISNNLPQKKIRFM